MFPEQKGCLAECLNREKSRGIFGGRARESHNIFEESWECPSVKKRSPFVAEVFHRSRSPSMLTFADANPSSTRGIKTFVWFIHKLAGNANKSRRLDNYPTAA